MNYNVVRRGREGCSDSVDGGASLESKRLVVERIALIIQQW